MRITQTVGNNKVEVDGSEAQIRDALKEWRDSLPPTTDQVAYSKLLVEYDSLVNWARSVAKLLHLDTSINNTPIADVTVMISKYVTNTHKEGKR